MSKLATRYIFDEDVPQTSAKIGMNIQVNEYVRYQIGVSLLTVLLLA